MAGIAFAEAESCQEGSSKFFTGEKLGANNTIRVKTLTECPVTRCPYSRTPFLIKLEYKHMVALHCSCTYRLVRVNTQI